MGKLTMIPLALILACTYGPCAFYIFRKDEDLPGKLVAQLVYFAGYVFVMGFVCRSVASLFGFRARSAGSAFGLVLSVTAAIIIVALANLPAILCIVEAYITKAVNFATSDDQLVIRKQYCRAAGAAERLRFDEAVRLYREEIEKDPEDADVHRLLAEVLLKQGLADAAVAEFRTAIGMLPGKRDRASAMFRLGEILEDELNLPNAARDIFNRIIRDCPRTDFATHACKRLES
jgi:tetratricopeptide (TPR) repeat protein